MSDHKRERTVGKHEITPQPTARQMWNWWWNKIPLKAIKFEVVNNGREFKNGKDEITVNMDQGGGVKYFEHKKL